MSRVFFFQAEDGIRDLVRSRGLGDVYKRQVYTSDDPIAARELESLGCVAIMPLASLIGSGMGLSLIHI